MKNILSVLFLTILLSGGNAVLAQPNGPTTSSKKSVAPVNQETDIKPTGIKDGDGWEKYQSTGGGFEIFLPAAPQRESEPMEMPPIGMVDMVMYTSTTEMMVFMVGYLDFKIPINDPATLKGLYDNWRDGVRGGLSPGTITEKDGTFEGRPSRDLLYTSEVVKMKGRVFFAKGKMFQFMAMYPTSIENGIAAKEVARITDKFADSFRILEPATVTEKKQTSLPAQSVTDGIYRDDYFKFTLNLPKNWNLTNREDMKIVMDGSKERRNIYSGNTQSLLEKSLDRTTILFSLTKNEFGAADNVSLLGSAEKDVYPKSDFMLIAQVSENNFAKNMGYTITGKAKWTKLGEADAIVIEMQKNIETIGVVKQKLYLIRSKGYILEFVFSYRKDEDAKIPEEALRTFKYIR